MRLKDIPDWLITTLMSLVVGCFWFAVGWESLKSKVSAEVMAQQADNKDIRRLSEAVVGIETAMKSLDKRQDEMAKDIRELRRFRR